MRGKLLQRVLDAGFDVDKTVTADTRRIIRLPSSLHGKTGWVCTIIDRETLAKPQKMDQRYTSSRKISENEILAF